MANEFWNVIAGIIGGIIIGMALHSGMGHTWGSLLWEIFHKDEVPHCYGKSYNNNIYVCQSCLYKGRCSFKCRTSTE